MGLGDGNRLDDYRILYTIIHDIRISVCKDRVDIGICDIHGYLSSSGTSTMNAYRTTVPPSL